VRNVIIGLLFLVWLLLAYRAYQRGDMAMAALFLVIGVALAVYRLGRRRN